MIGFVTQPDLRLHKRMFGDSVSCKDATIPAGNIASLPSRNCGRRGWRLTSSQTSATNVKPARCFANPTFCTTLRLRGRELGAPLPRFRFVCIPRGSSWWTGIRVSSRLIRMIGRHASRAVRSAKFHNFHSAVAWQSRR